MATESSKAAPRTCSLCGSKHYAKGLCTKHYLQRPEVRARDNESHRRRYLGIGRAPEVIKKFEKSLSPATAKAYVLDGAVLDKRLEELMEAKRNGK